MQIIRRYIARFFGARHQRFPSIKFHSFIPVHYRKMMAFNPDIIYAHDLSSLPLSALIAKETNCKLVFDSHELEVHRNPPLTAAQKRQVHKTEYKYLPKCDYVTTVCESAEVVLRSEYGLKKTGLIFNAPALKGGVSHERWERRSGKDIRIDAGLAKDDFALIYVGLITINRGIEFALRAIEHLPENIKLVALGPGNANIKKNLKKYAADLGLKDRFIIIEPVNPPEVYEYIKGIDAAIIPITPITLSYEIALPNKFFESAFAEIPIICADLIEMKKLVAEYNLGISYDALDEQECANAIMKVYNDPAKFKPKTANTNAFKRRFAWEFQEKYILSVLDTLTTEENK